MSTRIQVVVDEAEREAFRQRARREGVSLSTWLREAGHRRLVEDDERRRIATPEELRRFFAALPDQAGVEPEWEDQKRAIESAIASGGTGT